MVKDILGERLCSTNARAAYEHPMLSFKGASDAYEHVMLSLKGASNNLAPNPYTLTQPLHPSKGCVITWHPTFTPQPLHPSNNLPRKALHLTS
jgi:hypothetical protein